MEARKVEEAPDIRLARIPKAFGFAFAGLVGAWRTEAAFRQEALVACAKDSGSAAVLVAIAIAALTWTTLVGGWILGAASP